MGSKGRPSQSAAPDEIEQLLLQEIKSRVGLRIGPWRTVKILGVGASAAVYRGEDEQGRQVAVKVMHRKFIGSQIVRTRFLRESEILSEIEHPNALHIFNTGITAQDEPYIVMELLEGMTLDRVMRKRDKPFSIPELYESIRPILEVLKVCHERQIIHRDLKPANIFLTKTRTIKLLDFGVARFHVDGVHLTRDGTALGTPAFMSPEQASGHLDLLDARSDIFSVGATMHYLLSQKYLHDGRTADETFIKAASTPAPSLARRASELPLELVRLVDKSVAWDPEDRWQNAQELLEQLELFYRQWRASGAHNKVSSAAQSAQNSAAAAPQQPLIIQNIQNDASMAPWMGQSQAPWLHPHPEAQAPEPEPATLALREVFRTFERMLDAMTQYGPAHTQSQQRAKDAWETLERALAQQPDAPLCWIVQPYSFETLEGKPCWEPSATHENIPYRLFTHGLRRFSLNTKLTRQEFDQLTTLMLIDPERDLSPEDDLASALWDLQMAGVEVQIVTSFRFDDPRQQESFQAGYDERVGVISQSVNQEIQTERERIELLLSLGHDALAEAEALVTPTHHAPGHAERRLPPKLEENLLRLRRAHHRQRESWLVRVSTLLGELTQEMLLEGDLELLISPLRELLSRFGSVDRANEALSLIEVVSERIPHLTQRQELIAALLPPHHLSQLFAHLGLLTIQPGAASLSEDTAQTIERLLPSLDHHHLETIARSSLSLPAQSPLRQQMGRWMAAHIKATPQLGPTLSTMIKRAHPALGDALLELTLSHSEAAPIIGKESLQHPEEALRLRALEWLLQTGHHDVLSQLEGLLWAKQPATRIRTLQALTRAQLRSFIPQFIQRFTHANFHLLPEDERALNFNLLQQLSAHAAEVAAQELLNTHNVIQSAPLQRSREMATSFLAQFGSDEKSLQALEGATKRRPWNTRELQEAAAQALERCKQRLQATRGGA